MFKISKYFFVVAILFAGSTVCAQDSEPLPVKIMTYNIWNGFDWGKDTIRKAKFIEYIKDKAPNVLALQELCGYDEEQLRKDAKKWGHGYVQLLKTDGYPTGLTSDRPIELKERLLSPFWHGLLHCKTYGIDFFVVHLSPADALTRLKEAQQISRRIRSIKSDSYIVLGDFNAFSPMDATWIEENDALRQRYIESTDEKYSNLRSGEFDYSVISTFLGLPCVDVCLGKTNLQEGDTFPTQIFMDEDQRKTGSKAQNSQRIDFILAAPLLAKRCIKADILNINGPHLLSDHYPVMAEFMLND
ncbi:MAG: endonuclease/exonuclease/phosphatase family protein [Bacteroidota bacterium]